MPRNTVAEQGFVQLPSPSSAAFVAQRAEQKAVRTPFTVLLAFLVVFRNHKAAADWGRKGKTEGIRVEKIRHSNRKDQENRMILKILAVRIHSLLTLEMSPSLQFSAKLHSTDKIWALWRWGGNFLLPQLTFSRKC